jgi:hypothetical protein
MLSCLNARTGQPYYAQMRLPEPYRFKSSLVGVNGKLYMASEDGDVVVVKMGEKFEVLATNTLADEFFVATPAVADGEMCLRAGTRCTASRKRSRPRLAARGARAHACRVDTHVDTLFGRLQECARHNERANS